MKYKTQWLTFVLALFCVQLMAQDNIPKELRGNRKYRKEGIHNGNLVETLFYNFGEVAWWGRQPSGVWPRGSGHSYMDGITPIVVTEVINEKGQIEHICEAGYRELMDVSPEGIERGWQPRPGYANPNQDNIAMSDNPNSWPNSWPDKDRSWDGYWNGYFGKRTNADQESYFVMDDDADDGQNFYPDSTDRTRRGLALKVGVRGFQWSNMLAEDLIFWHYDITNEATTPYQKMVFGMYVDVGIGGQWDSNDDNASFDINDDITYSWDTNGLGAGGWGPTGWCGYAFLESPGNPYDGIDNDGDGEEGSPTITADMLIGEIPGNGIDDNNNGLIDEAEMHIGFKHADGIDNNGNGEANSPLVTREMVDLAAGDKWKRWPPNPKLDPIQRGKVHLMMVEANDIGRAFKDNIDNNGNGEKGSPVVTQAMIDAAAADAPIYRYRVPGTDIILYDVKQEDLGKKYADGIDNDGNGAIDEAIDEMIDEMIDERRDDFIDNDGDWNVLTDDVGQDGIAGTGDFGEGDGIPTPGEPNFDATDKDESDQIGLTAFDVFYIGTGVAFYKDDVIWDRISNSHFDTRLQNGNIAFLYGSGHFPLYPKITERFSVCLVFGENQQDIFRNKQVVQDIYNENYNFARPPDKPQVWAVPGDKNVTLYWDDKAEESYDPFSDPPYDFEGYKIYKSTDPGFLDARIITNAFGEKTLLQPVAQFDIRNEIEGFFPLDYQGIKIYLGDNKGLKHSWTDYDVINGKTYYYAVVSYDRGDAGLNMYPSECSRVIVRDINGNVRLDKNTVEVTPQAAAAGYQAGGLQDSIRHINGFATGNVWLDVLDPLLVKDNQTYQVAFDDTTHRDSIGYNLINITTADLPDTIIDNSLLVRAEDYNPIFSGKRLFVFTDSVEWDGRNSGWISGDCNLPINVEQRYKFPQRRKGYPSSYEIRFGDPDTTWWYVPRFPVNFSVWDVYENEKVIITLEEPNAAMRDSSVSPGDFIRIIIKDGAIPREVWRINFLEPYENKDPILPEAGDVLYIQIKTPFRSGDVYQFTTKAAKQDKQIASQELDNVAVVPNPYVVAARWEPPRLFASGRGERRIFFIHLPQKCTIRIYTISGQHVRTIDHHSNLLDGAKSWDLTSKDGLDIAAGVYIYHVDAGEIGEKIGRFALIK